MMTGAKDPRFLLYADQDGNLWQGKDRKDQRGRYCRGDSLYYQRQRCGESVVTGADGMVSLYLLPGTYLVTEQPIDHYVTPASQYITIESGQTASVQFSNILKKFRVEGHKVDAETGEAQGDASWRGLSMACIKAGSW